MLVNVITFLLTKRKIHQSSSISNRKIPNVSGFVYVAIFFCIFAGEMEKYMWQEKHKPVWWQEHVSFVSPNSGSRETNRQIVAVLDIILESLLSYVRKSEVSAREDCNDEMNVREEMNVNI